MTRSIWRWSYLLLALVASLFLILSAISGVFLALEPIHKKVNSQTSANWGNTTVKQCIDTLSNKYLEVTSIENKKGSFIASVLNEEGEFLTIPINPQTGEKVGKVVAKNAFFKWMNTFHRSLFLDTLGRFFVGVVAVLLFFIAFSGIILVFQRSKSFNAFFDRVEKTSLASYYHVVFGRLFFIPILIISITGGYMFLQRFKVIKEEKKKQLVVNFDQPKNQKQTVDFSKLYLKDIRKIEFPFSPDEEDYFVVQTKNGEKAVDQYDFTVLGKVDYPTTTILKNLSLDLHTGRTNILWAIVLGISSISILYFIYSGLKMFVEKQKGKIKNKYKLSEAEILILVGSEKGNTLYFAKIVFENLLANGYKVYFSELNNYKPSESVKELIVFTSTYGIGEPPVNAKRFLKNWIEKPMKQQFNYSVVGFGSLNYADFCQFALTIQQQFIAFENAHQRIPIVKIHNQSYHSLKTWSIDWGGASGYTINLPASIETKKLPLKQFEVVERKSIIEENEETFTLTLKGLANLSFSSGDLLAIYPEKDPVERLYSIGKLNDSMLIISVKKHDLGICSNYLASLTVGSILEAGIKQNKEFHFNRNKSGILIGNGTGIGPFLGMISENLKHQELHLYWGGRTENSYSLYKSIIDESLDKKALSDKHIALSRQTEKRVYVGDLLLQDAMKVAELLKKGTIVYICGSLSMQQSILQTLEIICKDFTTHSLNYYQQKGRIKMDCY